LRGWRRRFSATGMTLVPLKIYFNDKGRAKLPAGLAKGKKTARQARDPEGTRLEPPEIPAAARARLRLGSPGADVDQVSPETWPIGKDRVEHLRCQAAGVGVVARAMIARENRTPVDFAFRPMTKRMADTFAAERATVLSCEILPSVTIAPRLSCIGFHCRVQELAAGVDFGTHRLVLRRHAPHGIGDCGALESQAVIAAGLELPSAKPCEPGSA
jgi:hypothetical protein